MIRSFGSVFGRQHPPSGGLMPQCGLSCPSLLADSPRRITVGAIECLSSSPGPPGVRAQAGRGRFTA